jgi:hypothetical protein
MSVCVFDVTPGGIVVQISRGEPSDTEWNAYLDCLVERDLGLRCAICFAYGASGPNTSQRKALSERTLHVWRRIPFAMISDSRVMRGVMTAINWLFNGKDVVSQAFSSSELEAAYRFLQLSPRDIEQVVALRTELAECAGRPSMAPPSSERIDSGTRGLKRTLSGPKAGAA